MTCERLLVNEMSIVGEGERVMGDLYNSDYKFAIDGIRFIDAADQARPRWTTSTTRSFPASTRVSWTWARSWARARSVTPALTELKFEIDEVHYDFSLRRLHAETLEKLITSIKLAYTKPVATAADVEAALITPIKEHGIALLKHDPEFVIDRIGIVTPEGEGYIKGVIRLKGVTDADFPDGSFGRLVSKVEADFTIEMRAETGREAPRWRHRRRAWPWSRVLPDGKVKSWSATSSSGTSELKINGKPQPIPGLGQGPPADPGMESPPTRKRPPKSRIPDLSRSHVFTQEHPSRHRESRAPQRREVRDSAGLHRHQGRSEVARRGSAFGARRASRAGSPRRWPRAPGSAP